MKILDNGTVINVGRDSVLIKGKSSNGNFGMWILKRRERIHLNEPTIRIKVYSKNSILQLVRSL